MFRGKKYKDNAKLIDRATQYEVPAAMDLVVKTASAKFDETVEVHIKLGVDSRHADQQVRGAIVLPNGTGKTRKVLVFAKDAKLDEAKEAGADFAGGMELVEKIQKENWFDFDVVVATPDMMGIVGRLGKVLGPKGLMPSPKAGTVTQNGRAVELTPREFTLLLVLVRARGQALYRDILYERVWGPDAEPNPRALDLHIHRLRKKLDWADKIVTVPKVGYKLLAER